MFENRLVSVRTRLFDKVFCCKEVKRRWLAVPALQRFKIIGAATEGLLVLATIWDRGSAMPRWVQTSVRKTMMTPISQARPYHWVCKAAHPKSQAVLSRRQPRPDCQPEENERGNSVQMYPVSTSWNV